MRMQRQGCLRSDALLPEDVERPQLRRSRLVTGRGSRGSHISQAKQLACMLRGSGTRPPLYPPVCTARWMVVSQL